MKIKKLILNNIQSHKKTVLELSPNVNVIKGRSHSGKSSIIRGIRWTAFNEPKGVDLRSWDIDKEKSSFTIEFDKLKIERFKEGLENGYMLNGEKLKAIRFSVPSEVSDAFPFKSINFQDQSELYFLFLKSPGEVAEILNDIAGISEVDKCYKSIGAIIRETSHEVNSIKARIERTETNLKNLQWVDSAKFQIDLLDKQIKDHSKIKEDTEKLGWDIEEIEINEELLESAKEYLQVKPLLTDLKKQIQIEKETKQEASALERLIDTIDEHQEIIDSAKEFISVKPDIKQIQDLITQSNLLAQESILLYKIMSDIELQIKRQESFYKKLELAKKEQATILKTHSEDFCPYCGSFRTHWREV